MQNVIDFLARQTRIRFFSLSEAGTAVAMSVLVETGEAGAALFCDSSVVTLRRPGEECSAAYYTDRREERSGGRVAFVLAVLAVQNREAHCSLRDAYLARQITSVEIVTDWRVLLVTAQASPPLRRIDKTPRNDSGDARRRTGILRLVT